MSKKTEKVPSDRTEKPDHAKAPSGRQLTIGDLEDSDYTKDDYAKASSTKDSTDKSAKDWITVEDNAEMWNFNENPEFMGVLIGETKLADIEDRETGEAKEYIVWQFHELDNDSVLWNVKQSFMINRGIHRAMEENPNETLLFQIEFGGKVVNSKGQPLNKFVVRYKTL